MKNIQILYTEKVNYHGDEHLCNLLHVPHSNWVLIYFPPGEIGIIENNENKETVVFAGQVKNKSELKKIMQMLKIKKP